MSKDEIEVTTESSDMSTEEVENMPNFFDMSDEEIMNMNQDDMLEYGKSGLKDENNDSENKTDIEEVEEQEVDEVSTDTDDVQDVVEDVDEDSIDAEELEQKNSSDAQAQLDKLLSPFKANGREISVKNVDEAITLMQMGANYNKKMAALKPAMKVAKMLENNKLLDENTVSYLIDLQKGKPEAIEKLLKDSKFDVDNFDGEKDSQYTTTNEHSVTDEEMALDDVLSEIRTTDTYEATMKLIGSEWDKSSKSKLVANPVLISKINEHQGNGLFAKIDTEVQRQKALGQLTGLSDLDSYFHVGQQMMAQGLLGDTPTTTSVRASDPIEAETARLAEQKKEQERKAAKKAAKSTKATPRKVEEPKLNPFEMSDEEFAKIANHNFY